MSHTHRVTMLTILREMYLTTMKIVRHGFAQYALYRQTRASIREGIMVLHSTRWLALSYFTYFLATVFFYHSGASGWQALA